MSEYLSNLKSLSNSKRKAKRVGKGIGSGKGGHVAGRGSKGQKSRSGGKTRQWFEGGQTPLVRKLPYMRGFINHNSIKVTSLNISDIASILEKNTVITPILLAEQGVIPSDYRVVKILGKGKLDKKVEFEGFQYSKKSKEKIEKAGGTAK